MPRRTKEKATAATPVLPDEEAIRARAYQIFESRGRVPGHETDDWQQAERELRHKVVR